VQKPVDILVVSSGRITWGPRMPGPVVRPGCPRKIGVIGCKGACKRSPWNHPSIHYWNISF